MRTRVGTEMDVIDVKATGLLAVGGRVNMAQPGQGGAEDQQETQDHGSNASHSENYRDRACAEQATFVPTA